MDSPSRSKRCALLGAFIQAGRMATLLTFAVLAQPGWAQSPAPGGKDELALFGDIPVVSGASRFEQAAREAPASVSVVTAEDIRNFGYRTLADIIRSVRGFTVNSDRNYSYIGVRGFTRTGDYNSRVLLLVDGRRVNDNVYDDVGLGNEGLVDVALIDRVEVIRGPGSSLYGGNAFFAVLNVITRRGRDQSGLLATAGVGSNGSNTARLSYGKRYDTGLEVTMSASVMGSRGDSRLYFPEYDTPATNNGIALRADGERADHALLKLRYGAFTVQAAAADRTKVVPTAPYGSLFNDSRTQTRDQRSYLELRYEDSLSSRTDVSARVSYNASDYAGDYAYAAGASSYVNKDYSSGRWWTGEFLVTTRLGEAHRLSMGLDRQENRRIEQGNYDFVVRLHDHRHGHFEGVYVQDEWRLGSGVILNAGLRYDEYSTFGSSVNPRIALVLMPSADTTVKLMGGRAFRPPNAYELFYNDGNVTQRANPGLKPERIGTYEAEVEQRFTGGWVASARLFRYRLHDLISQVVDAGTGLLGFANIEEARSHGGSVELARKFNSGASLRVTASRNIITYDASAASIIASPRDVIKLHALMPVAAGWFAGFESLYQSRQTTLSGAGIGGRAIANLTLRRDQPGSNTFYSASIYNLFDRAYADPGASEHLQDRIPQPRRTVWVQVHHKF